MRRLKIGDTDILLNEFNKGGKYLLWMNNECEAEEGRPRHIFLDEIKSIEIEPFRNKSRHILICSEFQFYYDDDEEKFTEQKSNARNVWEHNNFQGYEIYILNKEECDEYDKRRILMGLEA